MKTTQSLQLVNTYSLSNVGDAAIYAALIKLANTQGLQDFDFPSLVQSDEEMSRFLGRRFVTSNPIISPAFLAVGGDIFNNARPKLITRQFLKNVNELKQAPKSTLLFGQSIPRSCYGFSFHYLCHHLKKLASVVVRDNETFMRLKNNGVNSRLSYDAAFAAPINLDHHQAVLNFNQTPFDKLVLVSLRSFGKLYPHDNDLFVQEVLKLVKRVNQMGLTPAVILQSDVNHSDSDVKVIKEINKYSPLAVIDPFKIHHKLPHISPWQIAQAYIAQAKIVIGVRYHTAIFRLLAGKMPFNLYYSNKGEDLCKRLNVPGVAVKDFSVDEHFQEILESGHQTFDAQVITEQVKKDFADALAKVYSSANVR